MSRSLLSEKKEAALRQLLGRAIDHHRKGLLAQAERLYLQVLQGRPRQAQAQHMFGVLRAQQGRLAEALELVGSSIKADPASAAALSDHGLILHKLDRQSEALASFDRRSRLSRITRRRSAIAGIRSL